MKELTGQLYFPFMLDFRLSEYVQDEFPYMKQCHAKFESISEQHLSLNDFLVIHYCNPDSLFYGAEHYFNTHNPSVLPDGYIVSHNDFNNRLYKRDRAS